MLLKKGIHISSNKDLAAKLPIVEIKPGAIRVLEEKVKDYSGIKIITLMEKYPQSAKKAAYIFHYQDYIKCNSCGLCAEKCPKKIIKVI